MSPLCAIALSAIGGWLVMMPFMRFIRWTMGTKGRKARWFHPLDFWLGVTERSIATVLVIFAPTVVAGFIGGWVALKFAANWQRRPSDVRADDSDGISKVGQGSQIFLIGNAASFAIAIACGLAANGADLAAWQSS